MAPFLTTAFLLLSSTSAILLSLAASPFAAPNPAVSWTAASAPKQLCGASTYDIVSDSSTTAPAAADWEECAALYSSWTAYEGIFNITLPPAAANSSSQSGFVPILNSTECTLGVKAATGGTKGHDSLKSLVVGDKDLEIILDTALNSYSDGSDLAVTGRMRCGLAGGGGKADLVWEIYHQAA